MVIIILIEKNKRKPSNRIEVFIFCINDKLRIFSFLKADDGI